MRSRAALAAITAAYVPATAPDHRWPGVLLALSVTVPSVLACAGAVRGVLRLLRATRRVHRRVRRTAIPTADTVARMAGTAEVRGGVTVFADAAPVALTLGWVRPRVAVSSGLVDALTPAALEAVLRHERHHQRRHDPLRRLGMELACAVLWFVPALRAWRTRVIASQELAADRRAVRACGPAPVAAALLKVAGHAPASPAAAMANPDLLAARVAQLEGAAVTLPGFMERAHAVRSIVGLAVAGWVVGASATVCAAACACA